MKYKYKDKVGNAIHADSDVYFDPVQGVVQIISIEDPSRKKDGSNRPGYINMMVRMPFIQPEAEVDKDKDEQTIAFGFLLFSRDPSRDQEESEKGNRAAEAIKDILNRNSKIAQMKM